VAPLKQAKSGRLEVNWALIDAVIQQTKGKLLEVMHITKPQRTILRLLDVEEQLHRERKSSKQQFIRSHSQYTCARNMAGIWDDLFTGVRYVKLQQFHSHLKWSQPIMHLESHPGIVSSLQQPDQT